MKFLVLSYLSSAVAGALAFIALLAAKVASILSGADLEWLTWFWVFSPLWMAWAVSNAAVCGFVLWSVVKDRMSEGR